MILGADNDLSRATDTQGALQVSEWISQDDPQLSGSEYGEPWELSRPK